MIFFSVEVTLTYAYIKLISWICDDSWAGEFIYGELLPKNSPLDGVFLNPEEIGHGHVTYARLQFYNPGRTGDVV